METEQTTEAKIKVIMKETFYNKINWFVNNYDLEIGAFIEGEINEEAIILKDLLIPEQDVNTGSVEIKGKSLVKLRQEYKDRCKSIIGEWHSHNTMSAFWSITDDAFIEKFSAQKPISIYVVSGKTDGHLVRIEIRKPFFMSIDKVGYEIDQTESKLSKILLKEIEKKVKQKEYATQTQIVGGYDYPLLNSKKKRDKQINKEAGKMLKFFNTLNVVEVGDLSLHWQEILQTTFEELEPKIKQELDKTFTAEFTFKNKKEAIKGMHNIRQCLKGLISDEADLQEIEPTQVKDSYSNVGGYGKASGYPKHHYHPDEYYQDRYGY